MRESDNLAWRKSNGCDSNLCVEVAVAGDQVLIRNSAAPDVRLSLSHREWSTFVSWLAGADSIDTGGMLAA